MKPIFKKRWLGLFTILVVIGLACGGGAATSSPPPTTSYIRTITYSHTGS